MWIQVAGRPASGVKYECYKEGERAELEQERDLWKRRVDEAAELVGRLEDANDALKVAVADLTARLEKYE